jgi:hypothetical protein
MASSPRSEWNPPRTCHVIRRFTEPLGNGAGEKPSRNEAGENLAKTLPGSQVSANNYGHLCNNGPETAGPYFRMKKFWELREIPSI